MATMRGALGRLADDVAVESLFEKTSVGSRQELVARIFLDDYLPHLASHAPLTADGAFGG
jgi:hypothetical protein